MPYICICILACQILTVLTGTRATCIACAHQSACARRSGDHTRTCSSFHSRWFGLLPRNSLGYIHLELAGTPSYRSMTVRFQTTVAYLRGLFGNATFSSAHTVGSFLMLVCRLLAARGVALDARLHVSCAAARYSCESTARSPRTDPALFLGDGLFISIHSYKKPRDCL